MSCARVLPLLLFLPLVLCCGLAQAADIPAQTPDNPGSLEVIGTFPVPGELLGDRLVIYFDQPIQVEDPAAALRFDPPFPGKVVVGDNYLSFFRDTSKTRPRGLVRVDIHESVRGKSGARLPENAGTLRFPTFALAVQPMKYNQEDESQWYFQLEFNVPVSDAALQEHLQVKDAAGNDAVWRLMSTGNATVHTLGISKEAVTPLQVTVTQGLPPGIDGPSLAAHANFRFPAEEALTVSGSSIRSADGETIARLRFSAPVLVDSLSSRLRFVESDSGEEISYYIQTSGSGRDVAVVLQQDLGEGGAIQVEIAPGVISPEASMLTQAYSSVLNLQVPALQVGYHYWDTQGVGGALLRLQLNRLVPVEEFRKHLRVEPAVEDLRIESQGYRNYSIYGEWKAEEFYTLKIAPALVHGRESGGEPLEVVLEEAPKAEGVGFGYAGKIYFPRRSTAPLELQARNVSEATVQLYQLFPNNIVPALERVEGDYTYSIFGEKYAQLVGNKKIKLPESPDTLVSTPLSLEGMLPPDRKGIFGITAEPSSGYQDTRLVLWTNIGLLAHWQRNELVVFAHDLFTLEPLRLAKVTVYSTKNQAMGFSNTDERGIAHLKALNTALGTPRVVVVETEGDYTFLELSERTDDPTGFTESMPRFDSAAYDAFLYGDRTLYRPGETAHLRWVVRTGGGEPVAGVPLQVRVLNPKGNAILTSPTTLSELGTGGMDLDTETIWLTGKYTLELSVPGSDLPLGTYAFNLEEFVPQRLRATVAVAQKLWLPEQEQAVTVGAEHLFGAPAEDRTAELNLIFRKGEFKSAQWPDFRFGNDEPFQTEVISLGEARTDAAGQSSFSYAYKPRPEVTFPLAVGVSGQVSELGGRAVRALEEVTVLPAPVLLGIAAAGQAGVVDVAVAAINADETPASLDKVTVSLEREVWHYFVRRYQSYNEPKWDKSFTTVETREITLEAGRGTAQFKLSASYGYYRIRVTSEATPQFSTQAFYAYWRTIELVRAVRPSLIKLSLDRDRYNVGEEVELRIESPFDGTAFVVRHGEALQETYTTPVQDGLGTLRFIADHTTSPNVWLEATVVHVVEEGRTQVYPYSSFAMINVPVKDPVRQLQVSFPDLPREVRPEREIDVTVQTQDRRGEPVSAEVTLALVDEGIHQILGYDLPDPVAWFQRSRQPDFRRAHYYDRVAYDFDMPGVGGDLLARRLGKTSDVTENWIKPLALWSGVVQTGEDGRASVQFTLPKFSGQVRLVALATTAQANGAAEAYLYVRQPYMLQTSLPRFLLPGDTFEARAVLYNTTDAEVNAKLSWTGEGTVSGSGTKTVAVPAKGETNVLGAISTGSVVGQGLVRWQVEVSDAAGTVLESLEETAPIPVLPPSVYQSDYEMVILQPGDSRSFQNTRFRDDQRVDMKISAGATPLLQLDEALKFLVSYPYGCAEQTTSSVLPLYVLRKHALLLNSAIKDATRYRQYIQAGMNRLFAMQTSDGGLSSWPGGSDSYSYGSVYALHFLTLLQQDREIAVPEQSFRALQRYVRNLLGEGGEPSDFSHSYLRAYALYVLALDGDTFALRQIQRFDKVIMPMAGRYFLGAALALNTQDPQRVREYLASRPAERYTERHTGGILNSEIRNTAVMVLARLQMNAIDETVHEDAQKLLRHLNDRKRYTTQEIAFVATALGLYLDTLADQGANAAGTVTGPDGEKAITGDTPFLGESTEAGAVYTITNTGQSPLFVSVTMAGIPSQGALAAAQQGVGVSREYRDEAGNAATTSQLAHGRTHLVALKITCEEDLNNLVVADLLPAGLEIENPRLDADALAGAEQAGAVTPSYLEVRDDRLVIAFDHLPKGVHHFYYLVRAVTPGAFQYPPVYAECMYEPALHGNSEPGTVEVVIQGQ